MKLLPLITSVFIAGLPVSGVTAEGWLTNFEQAKAQAASEKKVLLMDYTGSDWCEYCIRLNNEVFNTPAFQKKAPSSFVLLLLDYPQDESKLAASTIAQNKALQDAYSIEKFPTILLADAEGRPFAVTGYRKGGPEDYLKHLEGLSVTLKKRDAAFEKAEALSGVEKARSLKEGLSEIPEALIPAHYGGVLDQIRKLDPKDSLEMNARFGFTQSLYGLRARLKAKLLQGGEAVRTEADAVASENPGWTPQQKQKALLYVLNFLMRPKDDQTALKLVKDIKALDSKSEEGQIAENIRAQLEPAK